jgi:hypothetical protein
MEYMESIDRYEREIDDERRAFLESDLSANVRQDVVASDAEQGVQGEGGEGRVKINGTVHVGQSRAKSDIERPPIGYQKWETPPQEFRRG